MEAAGQPVGESKCQLRPGTCQRPCPADRCCTAAVSIPQTGASPSSIQQTHCSEETIQASFCCKQYQIAAPALLLCLRVLHHLPTPLTAIALSSLCYLCISSLQQTFSHAHLVAQKSALSNDAHTCATPRHHTCCTVLVLDLSPSVSSGLQHCLSHIQQHSPVPCHKERRGTRHRISTKHGMDLATSAPLLWVSDFMQVRLELCYQGRIDLVVTIAAHVLNDSQYANPGAWQPYVGPGQPDLEGHLITRRIRVRRLLHASFSHPHPSSLHPSHPCRTYSTVFVSFLSPAFELPLAPSLCRSATPWHGICMQDGFDVLIEVPFCLPCAACVSQRADIEVA